MKQVWLSGQVCVHELGTSMSTKHQWISQLAETDEKKFQHLLSSWKTPLLCKLAIDRQSSLPAMDVRKQDTKENKIKETK
jgi:hypothetical protein